MIKIGTTEIGQVKLGEANVLQVRNGNRAVFPYDSEIEYLQNTGTQFIDTGIKSAGNVYIKISLIDYFNADHLGIWAFGGKNGYLNKEYSLFINGSNQKVNFRYNNSAIECDAYSSYSPSSVVEIGGGIIKIGTYQKTYSQKTFTGSYNILLGGSGNGASSPFLGRNKIGVTYISDGTTTRNFIPVRVGQTGYMYDKVSGQLFGNAGTGVFIIGPDVV